MPRKQTLRLQTRARLSAERSQAAPFAAVDFVRKWKEDVRVLYERSSFTVREIARFAGIGERMLYKYAAAGNWIDRETRVSRRLKRLNPQQADRIASRARERVRVTDVEAARRATRLVARRNYRRTEAAANRRMRIDRLLLAALGDLAGQASADPRHERAVDAAGALILRQMQEIGGWRRAARGGNAA